jgi:threonine synthase
VEGSFDDCQAVVAKVLRRWPISSRKAVSFNSNNWANILALVVLYFHAALQLGGGQRTIGFSVPAASFAEVYAGYIAQKMGLPINQIIVATNKNDALHQFFQKNKYSRFQADRTLSPAMDLSIFANVERFIWELYQHNDQAVAELMQSFEHTGELSVANKQWLNARMIVDSYSVSDAQTMEEMVSLYRDTNYVIDPHTAIGVIAAKLYRRSMSTPIVTLAEISPLKSSSLLTQLGIPMASQQLPATGFSVGNSYYIKPDDIEEVNQVIMRF